MQRRRSRPALSRVGRYTDLGNGCQELFRELGRLTGPCGYFCNTHADDENRFRRVERRYKIRTHLLCYSPQNESVGESPSEQVQKTRRCDLGSNTRPCTFGLMDGKSTIHVVQPPGHHPASVSAVGTLGLK